MSELTKCNFCSLQHLIARYGEDNVRVVTSPPERMPGWQEVLIHENGKWEPSAWFMELTDHCVC